MQPGAARRLCATAAHERRRVRARLSEPRARRLVRGRWRGRSLAARLRRSRLPARIVRGRGRSTAELMAAIRARPDGFALGRRHQRQNVDVRRSLGREPNHRGPGRDAGATLPKRSMADRRGSRRAARFSKAWRSRATARPYASSSRLAATTTWSTWTSAGSCCARARTRLWSRTRTCARSAPSRASRRARSAISRPARTRRFVVRQADGKRFTYPEHIDALAVMDGRLVFTIRGEATTALYVVYASKPTEAVLAGELPPFRLSAVSSSPTGLMLTVRQDEDGTLALISVESNAAHDEFRFRTEHEGIVDAAHVRQRDGDAQGRRSVESVARQRSGVDARGGCRQRWLPASCSTANPPRSPISRTGTQIPDSAGCSCSS